MTFEEYWEGNKDRLFIRTGSCIAKEAWQAAQEAFKEKLDDELTAAFMLGYEAAKNDYNRDK